MIINEKEKRHDFYDSVQTFGGTDKSIVYNRDEEILDTCDVNLSAFGFYRDGKPYVLETHILAFCGKLYPFVTYLENQYSGTKFFEYSPDFAKDFDFGRRNYKNSFMDFKNWFLKNTKTDDSYNIKYKTPIVLFQNYYGTSKCGWGGKTILNPLLKDIQFYKVMDPFTTFQNIEMFIGSMLCTERQPKPDNVEDKYKIEQKGFDKKFSFRKPKQGK